MQEFFSQEEVLTYSRLAFEYAVVFMDAARDLGLTVNRELVSRLEEVITKEFAEHDPTHLATQMIPNVMSALQPKEVEPLLKSTKKNTMAAAKKGGMKKGGKGGKC